MTIADFLSRLDGVRSRGARWSARCPAHADKDPSLSVSEGDKGVLLRCWSGCTVAEICRSLGIEQRDLFFDALPHHGKRVPHKLAKLDRTALAWRYELAASDLRVRVKGIVEAGKQVTVSSLTDDELDQALSYMAQAYVDVERAELFEDAADDLRIRDFAERKAREQQPRVA